MFNNENIKSIDERLRLLIYLLNVNGFKTYWSCQGAIKDDEKHNWNSYIAFKPLSNELVVKVKSIGLCISLTTCGHKEKMVLCHFISSFSDEIPFLEEEIYKKNKRFASDLFWVFQDCFEIKQENL